MKKIIKKLDFFLIFMFSILLFLFFALIARIIEILLVSDISIYIVIASSLITAIVLSVNYTKCMIIDSSSKSTNSGSFYGGESTY